jgi:hypothetical protein
MYHILWKCADTALDGFKRGEIEYRELERLLVAIDKIFGDTYPSIVPPFLSAARREVSDERRREGWNDGRIGISEYLVDGNK